MKPASPAGRLLAELVDQPGSRWRVPTPALLVDLAALERNIARMQSRAAASGLALRPHAKTHKSALVARMQIEAGAVGVCCTKLGEAEALAEAGVRNLLLTSPVVGVDSAHRAAALARRDPGFAVVLDHPSQADALAAACEAGGVVLKVLIDVDVGLHRTGVGTPADALALAACVRDTPSLRLMGVQGYGGAWQHIKGLSARSDAVSTGMQRLKTVVEALRAAGHPIDLVSGGGTGTFATDASLKVLTEVQPGSYVFMDAEYREALGDDPDGEFEQSLMVQARVVHAKEATHFTIDAGLKAFATDGPLPLPLGPCFAGSQYFYYGDEHGGITRSAANGAIALGDHVELMPPHCDPTVDRYDAMVLVRGDVVVGTALLEAARCSQ